MVVGEAILGANIFKDIFGAVRDIVGGRAGAYEDEMARMRHYKAEYDQVVMNYGTLPLDELYHDLKPLSSNGGAVDHGALIAGQSQNVQRNTKGDFQLFRIGDAVSARNTHAAIYDALRLVKDL